MSKIKMPQSIKRIRGFCGSRRVDFTKSDIGFGGVPIRKYKSSTTSVEPIIFGVLIACMRQM